MPFGPNALFTVSATIFAAIMLVCCASLPLLLLEPSFSTKTGTPPACADDDKSNNLLNASQKETALQYKFFCEDSRKARFSHKTLMETLLTWLKRSF
jgi:hypothetical protein